MIATTKEMAVLMAATIIGIVCISAATPLVAEAQIAIRENGVGLVDQSNVEQTNVQVQNQEACTNSVAPFVPGGSVISGVPSSANTGDNRFGPFVPGGSVISGVQSNYCEVDQTQTATAVSSHEVAKNAIRNLPA